MVTAQERIGPGAVTGRCNSRCNSETALLALGVSRVFPGCFHANQGFPIGTHGPGTQAGTHGIPVLLAQVETALTSTNGGSEITHFPARVETASTKILYGSTMVFWNIPRARESGAAAGTRTDTASKPVSATG